MGSGGYERESSRWDMARIPLDKLQAAVEVAAEAASAAARASAVTAAMTAKGTAAQTSAAATAASTAKAMTAAAEANDKVSGAVSLVNWLQDELHQSEAECERTRSEHQQALTEHAAAAEAAEREQSRLKSLVDASERDAENERRRTTYAESELDERKLELSEAKKQIEALKKELRTEKESLAELRAVHTAETAQADEQRSWLRQMVLQLKAGGQLTFSNADDDDGGCDNDAPADIDDPHASLRAEVWSAQREHAQDLSRREETMALERSEFLADRSALQMRLSRADVALQAAEAERVALKEELQRVHGGLAGAEKEHADLIARFLQEREEMTATSSAQKNEAIRLQAELEASQQAQLQVGSALGKEKERVQAQHAMLEHVREEASRLRAEARRAAESQEESRMEISALNERLEAAQEARAELALSLAEQREDFLTEIAKKEAAAALRAQDEIARVRQEMEEMQKQVDEAHTATAALSAGFSRENDEMLHAHEQHKHEVERLKAAIEEAQKRSAVQEREQATLSLALDVAKKEVEELVKERDGILEAHTAVILDLHQEHGMLWKEPVATGDGHSSSRSEPLPRRHSSPGDSLPRRHSAHDVRAEESTVKLRTLWLAHSSRVPEALGGLKRLAHFASAAGAIPSKQGMMHHSQSFGRRDSSESTKSEAPTLPYEVLE